MTQVNRYCGGCGDERPFEQFHADPGGCPDAPGGDCPEWGCAICGDALITGLPRPAAASSDQAARAA